jgi:hypothetical protein
MLMKRVYFKFVVLCQTWPAVHVVRVIEQCCFNRTLDPFNGQTANFIFKPPKVVESRTYVKMIYVWSHDMKDHWIA